MRQLVNGLLEKISDTLLDIANDANNGDESSEISEDDITAAIEEVKNDEGEVIGYKLKISGTIPNECTESIRQEIESEVIKNLSNDTYETIKSEFKATADSAMQALRELLIVKKSGDQALIDAAKAKFDEAVQLKESMEALKDEIDDYKEQILDIIDEYEDDENEENKDDDEEDEDDEDDEKDEKDGDDVGKELKSEEKLKQMSERIRNLINKRSEKRQQLVEKLKEHSENAAQKVETSTKGQIERKMLKLKKTKIQMKKMKILMKRTKITMKMRMKFLKLIKQMMQIYKRLYQTKEKIRNKYFYSLRVGLMMIFNHVRSIFLSKYNKIYYL